MAKETITVKEVGSPNTYGWADVTLEDGRTVQSKDADVLKEAFNSIGDEAEAFITSTTKGKFTNNYLNQINGVGEVRPVRRSTGAPRVSSNGGGRTPAENDRIAHQWAVGRAVELLVGSGAEFDFPLDTVAMQALQGTARSLIEMRDNLK